MPITPVAPSSSPTSPPAPKAHKIEDIRWEEHRATIYQIYTVERRSLVGNDGVIDFMKLKHNFHATKSQYQRRFKLWGMRKNRSSQSTSKWLGPTMSPTHSDLFPPLFISTSDSPVYEDQFVFSVSDGEGAPTRPGHPTTARPLFQWPSELQLLMQSAPATPTDNPRLHIHGQVAEVSGYCSRAASEIDNLEQFARSNEVAEPTVTKTIEAGPQDLIGKGHFLEQESIRTRWSDGFPRDAASPVEESSSPAKSHEPTDDIRQWIDGKRAAQSVSSFTPSNLETITSTSDFSATTFEMRPTTVSSTVSSRSLLIELYHLLLSQDQNALDDHDSPGCVAGDSGEAGALDSLDSPGDANDGFQSSSSPKSSTTTSGHASGSSQSSKRPYSDLGTSEEQDNDDEPPAKKPNREQPQFVMESKTPLLTELLMPCPLLDSKQCLGTNSTISELIRDMGTHHQIIICIECCTLLAFPDDGKKPEKVLNEHRRSENCIRRCVGQFCGSGVAPPHNRTPKCPSLRTVPPMLWQTIWKLVNPELEVPALEYTTGVGCLHDKVRRPRTRRTNDKVRSNRPQEIVQQIGNDLEAKEKQIRVLEDELSAAKDRLIHAESKHDHQLQQCRQESDHRLQECTQKACEQEEIIFDLLERVLKTGKEIEQSLQRRLRRVCPDVFNEALSGVSTVPSTSSPAPDTAHRRPPQTIPSSRISFPDLSHTQRHVFSASTVSGDVLLTPTNDAQLPHQTSPQGESQLIIGEFDPCMGEQFQDNQSLDLLLNSGNWN